MKNRKISTQLTIRFSVIMILLVIVFNFVLSFIFGREIKEQNKIILDKKLKLIDSEISKNYNTIIELTKKLRKDKELLNLIKEVSNYDDFSSVKRSQISEYLYKYSVSDDFISSIIAVNNNKVPIDTNFENKPFVKSLKNDEEFDYYTRNDLFLYFSKKFADIYKNRELEILDKHFICFSEYYDDTTFTQYGYMLININSKIFFDSLEDILEDTFDSLFIINRKGEAIFTKGSLSFSDIENKRKVSNSTSFLKYDNLYRIENNNYLVNEYKLEKYPNIKIVGAISYDKEAANFDRLIGTSLLIALVFIIIIILSSNLISQNITAPIREICNAMLSIKKEDSLPPELDIHSNEEINILTDGFNEMMRNIKNLIKQVREKEKKAKEYEVAKIQGDLDLLQSQMNPHFIHNTLNAISIMSMEHGTDDITDMIRSFNLLLRGSMDIKKRFLTIKEEIVYLKGYLNLHKYRYDKSFILECIYPPEFDFYYIPKFILQPLVENSLYHGIIPKGTGGKITIQIEKEDDKNLVIKVIDDGVGIPENKLEYIFDKNRKKSAGGFNQLCLFNIRERLNLTFSKDYDINIYSEAGIGTTVVFNIPILENYID